MYHRAIMPEAFLLCKGKKRYTTKLAAFQNVKDTEANYTVNVNVRNEYVYDKLLKKMSFNKQDITERCWKANDEYALAIIGTYIFTAGIEDISELDKLEQNEYIDKIKKLYEDAINVIDAEIDNA